MSQRDDFWNIDKLIPKKKDRIPPFSTKEKVTEITIPGTPKRSDERTKLTKMSEILNENKVYYLKGPLLRSVKITKFVDKYDFYGNFRKAAMLYYQVKSAKCEFVPFYSYMPQYSQMNTAQRNFYFYFRDSVRRGKYIKTDYSYLYLYIYEILNLPDLVLPHEGLKILVTLWKEYRTDLPNIDSKLSLWVQDYCLIYNFECPYELIKDFIFDIIPSTSFKEFYLNCADISSADGVSAFLSYLSDYDWRKGKYAGAETKKVYEKHMLGAMGLIIAHLFDSGKIIENQTETATFSRSAFANSLCTHSVKSRLDIEYVPLSNSENLRATVTAAIKYTENKLRALMGIKSRLSIKEIPEEYKDLIDSYFAEMFARVQKEKKKTDLPEYEKLYEAREEEMSSFGADLIEKDSWTTTMRLVAEDDSFDDYQMPSVFIPSEPPATERVSQINENAYGLTEGEISFLLAVSRGDMEAARAVAIQAGVLLDTMAERINEAFTNNFGDVVIEGFEPDYKIIDEYKKDVEEWLLKIMK